MLLGLALAALIGLSLGLLGGGGSILTVPVLVYVLGYGAKPAIAMSLPVVGVTSLMGAVLHWRMGNVRIPTAVSFGVFAMVGAFAGARLATFVSGGMQLLLLAVVMLLAAGSMMRKSPEVPTANGAAANDATARDASLRLPVLVPVAIGVGVLTGLIGIGGGFLVVPALVLIARVPMRQAIGTSLLVIAMNSAAGFAGYLNSTSIDWIFLARFTAAAIAGALIGTMLSGRVPQSALKRGFAVFLIVIGIFILYQNRVLLFPHTTVATVPARS